MGLYRLEDGSGLVPALFGVQRQTVLHYATAAARTAQLGATPPLGTLTFLLDVKRFEWWDPAVGWIALGADAALAGRVSSLETRMTAVESKNVTQDDRLAVLEARPTAPRYTADITTVTVGAEGKATIGHNLGVQPRTVVATPRIQNLGGGAILDVVAIDSVNTLAFRVELATNHGDWIGAGGQVAVYWLAIA